MTYSEMKLLERIITINFRKRQEGIMTDFKYADMIINLVVSLNKLYQNELKVFTIINQIEGDLT